MSSHADTKTTANAEQIAYAHRRAFRRTDGQKSYAQHITECAPCAEAHAAKSAVEVASKWGTKAEATIAMGRDILAGLESGNYTATVRASLPTFAPMVAKAGDETLAARLMEFAA